MSLLDGPDTVTLQPRVVDRTNLRAAGDLVASGEPFDVKRVTVRPLSDVELNNGGTEALSQKVIVSRAWPGDINTQIMWGGFKWDTVGEPTPFPGSRVTRHFEIRIERREPVDG